MEKDEKIVYRFMPIIIRRFRDASGFSQQEFADRLGVSKGFISALEGGRSVPNLDRLIQIADVLSVHPSKLMDALIEEINKNSSIK